MAVRVDVDAAPLASALWRSDICTREQAIEFQREYQRELEKRDRRTNLLTRLRCERANRGC